MSPDGDARLGGSVRLADMPVAAALVDRVGFVVEANRAFTALTSISAGDPLGHAVEDDVRPVLADLLVDDGSTRSAVLALEASSGASLAEFRVAHATSTGDAVVFALEKDAELDLLDDVVARSDDRPGSGVLVEEDGRLVHVGRATAALLGASPSGVMAVGGLDAMLADDERARIDDLLARRTDGSTATIRTETIVEFDGRLLPVELSISTAADGRGRRVVLVADAAHSADRDRRRAVVALRDELTGLPNRHLLLDRIDGLCRRLRRHPAEGALCVLDLDGFRPVNEELGFAAGDEVLRIIAARLSSRLRSSDTVARLGGDEFAVLCEDTRLEPRGAELAERVRAIVAEPIVTSEWEVEVEASVGVVPIDAHGADPAELLDAADRALRHDKTRPR